MTSMGSSRWSASPAAPPLQLRDHIDHHIDLQRISFLDSRFLPVFVFIGNGVARIFVWGGGHPADVTPGTFSPTRFSGGGGVVA